MGRFRVREPGIPEILYPMCTIILGGAFYGSPYEILFIRARIIVWFGYDFSIFGIEYQGQVRWGLQNSECDLIWH